MRLARWIKLIALLLGMMGNTLLAEETFYKEVSRDGQIYVFTRASSLTKWTNSGQLDDGVTRLFYGPNGETVVFDREEAVALYDRRHHAGAATAVTPVKSTPKDATGTTPSPKPFMETVKPTAPAKPVPVAPPVVSAPETPAAVPAASVVPAAVPVPVPPSTPVKAEEPKTVKLPISWKDGKTSVETEAAVLRLSTRIQYRFTGEDPDPKTNLGLGAGVGRSSFRVRRGELRLDGWIYKKNLTFEQIIDWTLASNVVQDLFLNWDAFSNKKIQVRMGQFKAPLGRQQLLPITNMQLVDRSTVTDTFTGGRDQGVQLGGMLWGERLDWRVALFNGNGRLAAANDNSKVQQNARLQFQPWGDPGLNESDFESNKKPLAALGVGVEKNDLHGATSGNDLKRHVFEVDGVVKFKGVSLTGEYFHRRLDPETGASYDSNGYFVQSGCFLNARRTLEVAARYASWDPTNKTPKDNKSESVVGVNHFINKQSLKVQVDFRRVQDKSRGAHDDETRAQIQWMF